MQEFRDMNELDTLIDRSKQPKTCTLCSACMIISLVSGICSLGTLTILQLLINDLSFTTCPTKRFNPSLFCTNETSTDALTRFCDSNLWLHSFVFRGALFQFVPTILYPGIPSLVFCMCHRRRVMVLNCAWFKSIFFWAAQIGFILWVPCAMSGYIFWSYIAIASFSVLCFNLGFCLHVCIHSTESTT